MVSCNVVYWFYVIYWLHWSNRSHTVDKYAPQTYSKTKFKVSIDFTFKTSLDNILQRPSTAFRQFIPVYSGGDTQCNFCVDYMICRPLSVMGTWSEEGNLFVKYHTIGWCPKNESHVITDQTRMPGYSRTLKWLSLNNTIKTHNRYSFLIKLFHLLSWLNTKSLID